MPRPGARASARLSARHPDDLESLWRVHLAPTFHTRSVVQTSRSAVSRVSKPANTSANQTACRFGNRRHSRFGNLRHTGFVRSHQTACEMARLANQESLLLPVVGCGSIQGFKARIPQETPTRSGKPSRLTAAAGTDNVLPTSGQSGWPSGRHDRVRHNSGRLTMDATNNMMYSTLIVGGTLQTGNGGGTGKAGAGITIILGTLSCSRADIFNSKRPTNGAVLGAVFSRLTHS